MRDTPTWVGLGDAWPNRAASRFIEAGEQRWHVQIMGRGPAVLLVHGIGGATHSWRALMPYLSSRFTVIAPDLPGHGFTTAPRTDRLSLRGLAESLAALLEAIRTVPVVGVAHGAGMAVLLELALAEQSPLRNLVGINAALAPPRPELWRLLAPAANVGVRSPLVADLGLKLASGSLESSLVRSSGSTLPPEQLALYGAFLRSRRHMGAVTTLLANWDVRALQRAMSRLEIPVTLAVGLGDAWLPPRDVDRIAMRLLDVRIVELRDAGHFAHEEQPALVETIIIESAQNAGLLPRAVRAPHGVPLPSSEAPTW